ncbi:EXLDI protein [Actinoplanes sp. NPDC051343]|uniref:EXLDI protein n=1 Tax=Actinoplanes sp. NPDC051343 TaxID=3363906 RepID=UPI0037B162AE
MPNKTIYVSDDDLALYARAQELSGGNLSATISTALKRYVEAEEGRREGYDEITVKVGAGPGRKVRFSGVLLGEWGRSTSKTVEVYRVYRTLKGKFAIHVERSPDYVWSGDNAKGSGWRGVLQAYLGPNQTWGSTQGDASLDVVETADELRARIPAELADLIAAVLDQPTIEELDI